MITLAHRRPVQRIEDGVVDSGSSTVQPMLTVEL
jgi:hypothetical protein